MSRSRWIFTCLALVAPLAAQDASSDPVRKTIDGAVNWIARQATPVKDAPDAVLFPGTAESPKARSIEVYGGNAGILIFLENAAAVLGDARTKALADSLAKGILAKRKAGEGVWASSRKTQGSAALYIGDAGIGHAFLVRARLRNDAEAMKIAIAAGDGLLARAKRDGDTLHWDDQTEVIYGASGTTLFLLELGQETKEARFLDAAKAACRHLVAKAVTEPGADGSPSRKYWRWDLGANMAYTGFSHGTAGTAYTLVRVGVELNEPSLLAAGREGAEHLKAEARVDGDKTYWPVIKGMKMSMGGWCHGPPGTARLFVYLAKKTGDEAALKLAKASARWVMAQAGPADAASKPTKAFPPSFCCGVAGVIDFFCDLYRATGDAEYAAFARRAGDYLIAAAKTDGDGVKWANGANAHEAKTAEHNVDLMLGASGEAFALLRLLTLDRKDDPIRSLPDRDVGAR